MVIKRIAIGNKEEAYISPWFSDGKNLIYSNDNNKGKTIILQSIVYALGMDPLFPKGFEYSKYKFCLDIEHNGIPTSICRVKNHFFVSHLNEITSFDDESGFKKWFDHNVFNLPKIVKNEKVIVCDFELFAKVFYIGQDRRDTSSLSSTYFKKEDFTNMVYSLYGCSNIEIDENYKELAKERKNLLIERKSVLRKTTLLKTYSKEASSIFSEASKEKTKESLDIIERLNAELSVLKRKRLRLFNRLAKNRNVLSEIVSIRKSTDEGRFVCTDCGSTNIKYFFDKNVSFDVSNDEMRQKIINNIKSVTQYIEKELQELDLEIGQKQSELKNEIKSDSVNPIELIVLKPDIINDLDYDNKLEDIRKRIKIIDDNLKEYVKTIEKNESSQKELDDKVKNKLTEIYRDLEDNDEEQIESLFTKGSELYSGSESTIFLVSRLLAFQEVLKHDYPIIIDGYREGEVSSPAERRVISYLNNISNQAIITATFKDEEYHKYDNDETLLCIDLSNIESKHLLNVKYVKSFDEILWMFCLNA